ncbi:hypothetical protein [Nonomuraea sp. SYSU D8015]|uniref:hypothetical protein n=1 Tax=Nonomuraea sp. SYSU D8015 TaxID=2593644 RepID=UPI0016612C13|nr:hypothetical protein [Nonomuraea sp. SYSU D8015]
MANEVLKVNLRLSGAKETLKAFRDLPKEANDSLRKRTLEISEALATKLQGAAQGDSAQSGLIAPTIKARRDRVPVIAAGGSRRVGRKRKPAHKILFGSEFGSNRLKQFRPHLGQGSYWFFRTVEANESEINETWNQVVADIRREFGNG